MILLSLNVMIMFCKQLLSRISFTAASRLCPVLLLILLSAGTIRAQNITRPNIVAPGGVQVNSYTGSLFCKRSDFYIPVQGLPLDVSFAYSSAARGRDHGFGYGWTFSYNQYYQVDSAGGITIYRGDGRQDHFTAANGAFKAPVGIFDVLTAYGTDQYKLTATDGTQYLFESPVHKKLTRIADRYGNKVLLSYTGSNITGISDSLGHTITFSWSNNHVTGITAGAASEIRQVRYLYDTAGYLTRVYKPMGVVCSYTYGADRMLRSYADGNGNYTNIEYNANSAVAKLLTCQLEQRITYNTAQQKTYLTEVDENKTTETSFQFDVKGRLINKTGNCCGYNTSYEYDAHNNVTRITDGNGGTRLYTYDNRGNILAGRDPLSNTSYSTYSASYSLLLSQTDKRGNQTSYTYDAIGNLLTETDPYGHSISYTYDAHGNRITKTDKKGNRIRYRYDRYGYLSGIINANGDSTQIVNDSWGNVVSETSPLHAVTQKSYDSLDRLVSVTNALGHLTRFTYDANGNQLTRTDPSHRTTSFAYNSLDKVIKVTDALNHILVMSYDGFGNMLSLTDANGHTRSYTYDNLNRLTAQTNGAGETTRYEYDGAGNRTAVVYPNGNTTRSKYDAASRLLEQADDQGAMSRYSYDADGNQVSEEDGKGNTTAYQYDALNRLMAATDALGNSWQLTYDFNGNLIQKVDRKGNISNYAYDSLDRRIAYTDALNHTTTCNYDGDGNIVSVKDANNNVTAYRYDQLNRIIQELFADNTTKAYTYDSAGNLKSRTDNALQTATFRYDAVNRPVVRAYSGSEADSFFYDRAGLLIAANSREAAVRYSYDAANRVTGETLNGKTTGFNYDIAGNRQTITYPGGRQVVRELDIRNQLKLIRENGLPLATYEYDLAGRNTKRSYGNGTVANIGYDADSRVTELNHNPARFVDFGYSYDKEGNPTMTQFRHNTSRNEQYGYDQEGQLTSFIKGASAAGTYQYDGVGNRTTAQLNGTPVSYSINNMNAYSGINNGSPVTLSYDANGSLTGDGIHTYSYDRENRLTAINGGATATYAYDALGRRIRKITATDTTAYYFDGLQVIEERDGRDSLKASYVWGRWIDDIVAMQRNGQDYFYHTNTLGSVVSVTDRTGAVSERYEYDAFGKATVFDGAYNTLTAGSAIGNSYLYTGRELDKESGLYYYRARYYDAIQGRFMQRDPIGYLDGMGVYAYVGNEVTYYIDPMGMSRLEFDRGDGILKVYPGDRNTHGPPQSFPAGNNTTNPTGDPWKPESHAPLPNGEFEMSPTERHIGPGGDPKSSFGKGFFPITLPSTPQGTRTGTGVHSGRKGPESPTQGCIRTTDDGVKALEADPPTEIKVQD